ncbi:MAG: helix-turn-helix domain-containing protein [Acidimicrobiales bacterium]
MRDKAANRATKAKAPRSVAVLVYEGVAPFELGVACDVFSNESVTLDGVPLYRLFVCSVDGEPVDTDVGFKISPSDGLDKLRRADTIVLTPTELVDQIPDRVFDEIRKAHVRGCRILSLCTGAFVLARSGLLDGRRATTHWSECDELSRRHPEVSVDPDVLFVDEGDILTSAGSAASIDLCLHVVRSDYGSEIATQMARELVVAPQRDGGQAQFIDRPLPAVDSSNLFADTIAWAQEHLDDPLTVNDLAARSAMSPRTFARRFAQTMGSTPHQWLLHRRVQLAQRLLEMTDMSIEVVAQASGFVTAGNLRKHFRRAKYTSPQSYRRVFQDSSFKRAG